jgi:hypothetical protein
LHRYFAVGIVPDVKHHYVPQFLLRRWTDATGKLKIFSVRNGRLVSKAHTPEYTGYEIDLYAIVANALGFPKHVLEERLFARIDDGAAKVLEKLEHHQAITQDEHIAWTFFLSSLRVRQPDILVFLRTAGMKLLKGELAEQDESNPPPGALTTEDWFELHYSGALAARTMTSWLPRMIFHQGMMDSFAELTWWFREFEPDQPGLLLSDLPLHWEGGLDQPSFFVTLPIAPHRLFIGTRSEETEAFLSQMQPQTLIDRVNITTLASSSGRIWAHPEAQAHAFIESRLDTIGVNAITLDQVATRIGAKAAA